MEGGDATDGADRTEEIDQGEPLENESDPTPPIKTARSDEQSYPSSEQKDANPLLTVARPEQQSPSEAVKPQDTFDPNTSGPEQLTPATVVMSPENQAQVARWKEQDRMGRIVPPGHDPEIAQRRKESCSRQDFGRL
jgi:hypothetical protein